MISLPRRIAFASCCVLGALAQVSAQSLDPCRQGLVALIVMIDAEEHERSHYRSTAKKVVESCGPARQARAPAARVPFDKAACGKLALALLDGVEKANTDSPAFQQLRADFAAQCHGG